MYDQVDSPVLGGECGGEGIDQEGHVRHHDLHDRVTVGPAMFVEGRSVDLDHCFTGRAQCRGPDVRQRRAQKIHRIHLLQILQRHLRVIGVQIPAKVAHTLHVQFLGDMERLAQHSLTRLVDRHLVGHRMQDTHSVPAQARCEPRSHPSSGSRGTRAAVLRV